MQETPLRFRSGELTLDGSLSLPIARGAEPLPVVLLVSGSGPIDRDSNGKRAPLAVMRQLAEHLAANGFAAFRYDKRGVGESEGDYKAAGLFDNVEDARAALEALRRRPEIDPARLFVLGHSEGAIIATELAAAAEVAGAVLLAGTAHPGKQVLQYQAERVAEFLPKWVRGLMKLLRQDFIATQQKRMAQLEATTTDVARVSLVKVNAKWFREFMAHDPAPSLARIEVPVLALTGAKDIQVDPADIAHMNELVPGPFEGEVLEDLSHLLRVESGSPSAKTYKQQMREPVARALLERVTTWLRAHARG